MNAQLAKLGRGRHQADQVFSRQTSINLLLEVDPENPFAPALGCGITASERAAVGLRIDQIANKPSALQTLGALSLQTRPTDKIHPTVFFLSRQIRRDALSHPQSLVLLLVDQSAGHEEKIPPYIWATESPYPAVPLWCSQNQVTGSVLRWQAPR